MHTNKISIEVDESKNVGYLFCHGCAISVQGFIVKISFYFQCSIGGCMHGYRINGDVIEFLLSMCSFLWFLMEQLLSWQHFC